MSSFIANRPRRAILDQKFVITEAVQKLLDEESESDEDFEPDKRSSTTLVEDESLSENEKVEKMDANKTDKKQNKKKSKKKSTKKRIKIKEDDDNTKIIQTLKLKQKPKKVTINPSEYVGPVLRIDTKNSIEDLVVYNVNNGRVLSEETNDDKLNDIKLQKERLTTVKLPEDEWTCTLCQNRPNLNGLGDLYGPYSNDSNEEIWLHEACAIWSPGLHVRNNQLCGLDQVLESFMSVTCSNCDRIGASLKCTQSKCDQTYHYKCALDEQCIFNEDNFTIVCNKHSANQK